MHFAPVVDGIVDLHLGIAERNLNEKPPKSVCATDTEAREHAQVSSREEKGGRGRKGSRVSLTMFRKVRESLMRMVVVVKKGFRQVKVPG